MTSQKSKIENLEEREIETFRSTRTNLIIKIAGGSIFGGLSIVLAFLAPLIPRIPPGIAFFDPISLTWIASFLLFGPTAGIISSFIGFIGLIPIDTSIPIIGPLMKLSATLPLIIVPTLILRLYKKKEDIRLSNKLLKPKNYLISALLSVVCREIVMIILNIVVWIGFGYPIAGLGPWLVFIIILNATQSIGDLLIPYLVIRIPKLNELVDVW
jgi:riboflavin transporter FmnP